MNFNVDNFLSNSFLMFFHSSSYSSEYYLVKISGFGSLIGTADSNTVVYSVVSSITDSDLVAVGSSLPLYIKLVVFGF